MKINALRNYSFLGILITFIAVFFTISTSHAEIILAPKAPSIMRPYIAVGIATNPFRSSVSINNEVITPNSYGLSVPLSLGIETVNPTTKLLVRMELEITPTMASETPLSPRTMYDQSGTTLFANLHLGTQWKYGSFYGIFGVGVAFHEKKLGGTDYFKTNFAFNIGLGGGVKITRNFGLDVAITYQNFGELESQHNIYRIDAHTLYAFRPSLTLRYTF